MYERVVGFKVLKYALDLKKKNESKKKLVKLDDEMEYNKKMERLDDKLSRNTTNEISDGQQSTVIESLPDSKL